MKGKPEGPLAVSALWSMLFVLTGCAAPALVPGSPEASVVPHPSESHRPETATMSSPPTAHRVGIRVIDGIAEFYDDASRQKFVPRGNNYIRLGGPGPSPYHATFDVGSYDSRRSDHALRMMHENGYNTVRVFLTPRAIGDPNGGLSKDYVANVVDFLERAASNDIVVMLTTDDFPSAGGYLEIQESTWSAEFPGVHGTILTDGGVRAETRFWKDLVQELRGQGAPLEAILAYELRNEQFFLSDSPPLTLESGRLTTANGRTYDVASPDELESMLTEGLVFWIDSVREGIRELDPAALVTIGFFVPHGPVPARAGDPRVVYSRPAIWESQADFLDLHAYPGTGLSLGQLVENFGMEGLEEKPILMGEFGAATSAFPSSASAAQVLVQWQAQSCMFGFDGWLLWTWDTAEDPTFHYGLDGRGEINQALGPVHRPDPCRVD